MISVVDRQPQINPLQLVRFLPPPKLAAWKVVKKGVKASKQLIFCPKPMGILTLTRKGQAATVLLKMITYRCKEEVKGIFFSVRAVRGLQGRGPVAYPKSHGTRK